MILLHSIVFKATSSRCILLPSIIALIFTISFACSYDQCLAAFTAFAPTHIIHLAAQVGGLFKNMARKFDMANDNFIINSNVLNAASSLRVHRVVSMTSTCVFPDKTECA